MSSSFQKIDTQDIVIGVPLPWNIYDSQGRLLLCKNYIINSKSQINRLLERGLFREQFVEEKYELPVRNEPLTPFDQMAYFQYRLNTIHTEIQSKTYTNLQVQINKFAQDIQSLCDNDPDAALGALHLDHDGKYSIIHPIHSALLSEIIAKRLHIETNQRHSILCAALTCNIGMIKLQDSLHKQESLLTEIQKSQLKLHPLLAVELLTEAGISDEIWYNTVLHHHEKIDGSGYPAGIKGEAISLPVRIVSLADTYAAMVTPRAYRSEFQAKEALREIFLSRGKEVDEDLAHVFIKELGIYPPGVFVRLNNGEIAVVTRRSQNTTCPTVQSIISPRGGPYSKPKLRQCNTDEFAISAIVPKEKNLLINMRLLWGYE